MRSWTKAMATGAVVLMFLAASAGAQDAPAPPGQGAKLGEIAFEPRVYDLFQGWLNEQGVDGLMILLRQPSERTDVAEWLDKHVLNHAAPQERSGQLVITVTSGMLEPKAARDFLRQVMGNFQDLVLREGDPEARERKAKEDELQAARLEAVRDQIRDLKRSAATRLMGRSAEQIALKLQELEEESLEAGMKRAELEARLEAVQKRLAEEPAALRGGVPFGKPATSGISPEARDRIWEMYQDSFKQLGVTREQFDANLKRPDIASAVQAAKGDPFSVNLPREANPVYAKLKGMLVDTEAELAGVRAQEKVIETYREKLLGQLGEAYEIEGNIERLERELPPSRPVARPTVVRRPNIRDPYAYPEPMIIESELPKRNDESARPGRPPR